MLDTGAEANMQAVMIYFAEHAGGIAFNVMLLVVCYLIARLLNVRPISALVFGFLPMLFGLVLVGGNAREVLAALV